MVTSGEDSNTNNITEDVGKNRPAADEADTTDSVQMRRVFGLHHGIAVICSLVVGSGIYISPKGVLLGAGSCGLSVILWGIAGTVSLFGGLSYAELGTTFPRAGEKYYYLEQMFGPFTGFIYLWTYLFVIRASANAIKCLTFAQYFLSLIYTQCSPPRHAITILAILMGST